MPYAGTIAAGSRPHRAAAETNDAITVASTGSPPVSKKRTDRRSTFRPAPSKLAISA
jgi:hypothetical protein